MSNQNIQVIFNPVSAGGKTQKRFKEIIQLLENSFGKGFNVYTTTRQNEAELISRMVIENGTDLIIGVGGDGTLNEIINGFYYKGRLINKNCSLGIISSGSGEGFSRSFGLPRNLSQQIEIIKNGSTKLVDIGRIIYSTSNGSKRERYFLNEFQVGIGGAVVNNVHSLFKKLGGTIAFGIGTVLTAITYPNKYVSIKMNNSKEFLCELTGLVVANGNITGGGMKLVPNAKMDDGHFDILFMHRMSPLQRLWNFPKIYTGSHIKSRMFDIELANHLEINSEEKIYIESDGELLGSLPCSVDLLSSQINICCKN